MDVVPENQPLPDADEILFEHEVQRLGRRLHGRLAGKSPGIFEAAYWQGLMMDWAMRDTALKTDLFRLVDALPALGTSDRIARHAREYLLADGRTLPTGLAMALRATENPLAASVSAFVIRQNVRRMAERFIVGRDARQARGRLKRLWDQGYAFTVDLLGEATVNAPESEAYASRYGELIEELPHETARWKASPILDHGPAGPIPRANISLKLSAMDHLLDPADPAGGVYRLLQRVRPLLVRAKQLGAFVNFDLEQWSLHEITYRLFETLAADPEFSSWPHLGIVVQAYLRRADADVDRLLALAERRSAPLTVRLVKGAYWDYEVVLAGLNGLPCPVFTQKSHTDANYERLVRRLFAHRDRIHPAFGTHNLRTTAVALAGAARLGLKPDAFEVQMLYGMAEPERELLRGLGYRVRLYAPVGDLLTGMAYLVRRLLENTANSSFLRLSHHDHADVGELLARPEPPPLVPPPDAKGRTADLRAPVPQLSSHRLHRRRRPRRLRAGRRRRGDADAVARARRRRRPSAPRWRDVTPRLPQCARACGHDCDPPPPSKTRSAPSPSPPPPGPRGATCRWKRGRPGSTTLARGWSATGCASPRWRSTNRPNRGARPMPTSPRRSTSAATTRARRWPSSRRGRSATCPARPTCSPARAAASAPSSRRGIFRSRFCAAWPPPRSSPATRSCSSPRNRPRPSPTPFTSTRSRPAFRPGCSRSCPAGGNRRRRAGAAQGRRADRVHRQPRGRHGDPQGGRGNRAGPGDDQARGLRDGRQERDHRRRRRGPRRGRHRRDPERLRLRGPEMLRPARGSSSLAASTRRSCTGSGPRSPRSSPPAPRTPIACCRR
ncbi:MAG: proline dehydrogenase family protein [Verrucomicrobiota bacterium]